MKELLELGADTELEDFVRLLVKTSAAAETSAVQLASLVLSCCSARGRLYTWLHYKEMRQQLMGCAHTMQR